MRIPTGIEKSKISRFSNFSIKFSENESVSPALRNSENGNQEDYCCPRPLSEAYSVPPAARPITASFTSFSTPPELPPPNPSVNTPIEENYSIAPTPTPINLPITTSTYMFNDLDQSLGGYLQMHPAGNLTHASISLTSVGKN